MKITEAESAVMQVLWEEAPLDGEEVADRLKKKWSRTTVRTLLSRLVKKRAVQQKKIAGKKDEFSPLLAQSDYQYGESRGLIDRLFDGRVSPLFAQLAQRADLSDDDLAEMKALIERIEDDRR